jgi:hypothetical protein
MVARIWVEMGHYGRLLNGEPTSASLSGGFPTVASIAVAFRLFGVGTWQGRLPFVVYTIGALALMYSLANSLYGRPIALGTLIVLFIMAPSTWLHPALMGRQVLGEMVMLFCLLMGFVFLFLVLQRSRYFMMGTVLAWGMALVTKPQLLPFWAVAMTVPVLASFKRRRWQALVIFAVVGLGSLLASQSILFLQRAILADHSLPRSTIPGLYSITAMVPVLVARIRAVSAAIILALPTLLGLSYAAWQMLVPQRRLDSSYQLHLLRLSLLCLASSWMAWYLMFSIGWVRYLFPVTFLSSLFVSAMLYDMSGGYNWRLTVRRAALALRNPRSHGSALLAVIITASYAALTLSMLYRTYVTDADLSVTQAADYLNTQAPLGALIETYDSELMFLLDRPYHYPPDQLHVDLNRRAFLGQDVRIDYDPLTADPDFVVVGPFSRLWSIYDEVLQNPELRLETSYGPYDIYRRYRLEP